VEHRAGVAARPCLLINGFSNGSARRVSTIRRKNTDIAFGRARAAVSERNLIPEAKVVDDLCGVRMKFAVVTGSSSGIGLATTRRLVRGGWRVFATVRKGEDAERLRKEFGDGVHPLCFDVRDRPAVETAAAEVRGAISGTPLAALVNNVGIGDPAPYFHQPFDDLARQIEVNVLGTMSVTHAFGPMLAGRNGGEGGRTVMMSSLGGIIGTPFAAAYCASKHALEGLAESLRRELAREGISVIIVAPALVATPVWQKVAARDETRFSATPYDAAYRTAMARIAREGPRGLPPQEVAEAVWNALTVRSPALRYAPARRPILEERLAHVLPRRLVDRVYAQRLGLRPNGRGETATASHASLLLFAGLALGAAAWLGSATLTRTPPES
jgi:NAD(P)-dependent dehydrogenase (short-subunit alcohol dehydrogenase family)